MANFKKFGPWFSYEGSPRAQIFKRDHNKVVDMDSMMKLMRYAEAYSYILDLHYISVTSFPELHINKVPYNDTKFSVLYVFNDTTEGKA